MNCGISQEHLGDRTSDGRGGFQQCGGKKEFFDGASSRRGFSLSESASEDQILQAERPSNAAPELSADQMGFGRPVRSSPGMKNPPRWSLLKWLIETRLGLRLLPVDHNGCGAVYAYGRCWAGHDGGQARHCGTQWPSRGFERMLVLCHSGLRADMAPPRHPFPRDTLLPQVARVLCPRLRFLRVTRLPI